MTTRQELDPSADVFLKYNYMETKDFCKQFLTLVVAVLVFSLTFSEKVVGFSSASLPARLCLALAWTAMLVSIVSCGVGLTYMALAGGDAVYGGNRYYRLAEKAYKLIVAAGGAFVGGLILLIVAAVTSVAAPLPSDRSSAPNQSIERTEPAASRPVGRSSQ